MALREDLFAANAKLEERNAAFDEIIELLEFLGDDEDLDDNVLKALNIARAQLY